MRTVRTSTNAPVLDGAYNLKEGKYARASKKIKSLSSLELDQCRTCPQLAHSENARSLGHMRARVRLSICAGNAASSVNTKRVAAGTLLPLPNCGDVC